MPVFAACESEDHEYFQTAQHFRFLWETVDDCYDSFPPQGGTLHFVAKAVPSGTIAGTARLVLARGLPADLKHSVLGRDPQRTLKAEAALLQAVLAKRDQTGLLQQRCGKATSPRCPSCSPPSSLRRPANS